MLLCPCWSEKSHSHSPSYYQLRARSFPQIHHSDNNKSLRCLGNSSLRLFDSSQHPCLLNFFHHSAEAFVLAFSSVHLLINQFDPWWKILIHVGTKWIGATFPGTVLKKLHSITWNIKSLNMFQIPVIYYLQSYIEETKCNFFLFLIIRNIGLLYC